MEIKIIQGEEETIIMFFSPRDLYKITAKNRPGFTECCYVTPDDLGAIKQAIREWEEEFLDTGKWQATDTNNITIGEHGDAKTLGDTNILFEEAN